MRDLLQISDSMAFCSKYNEYEICMSNEFILASILIECGFYFLAFTFGHRLFIYLKERKKTKLVRLKHKSKWPKN